MKFFKRFLPVFLLFMAVFVGTGTDADASASDENISVIVPVTVGITFNADGSTTSTTFNVFNRSSVGIEITAVNATELNDWKLVSSDTAIGLDSKQLSFELEGTEILPGENELSLLVKEMGLHNFHTDIKRGAWTYSFDYEEAFLLEFQFEIEKQSRILRLDSGDYGESSEITVLETTETSLPTLSNDKYEFMGWADSSGKRYTDVFTMPKEDTTLTALWNLPAYALYSQDDHSLTFVQSEEEIKAGDEFNGNIITKVYTDFTNRDFEEKTAVPWNTDEICQDVESVTFADPIFPQSTAYWFCSFENCPRFDVTNLYTFRVQNMNLMYYSAGRYRDDTDFIITGMENWDTSQVTTMWSMFEYSGWQAKTYHIGNIGLWDVSNVWDMQSMFGSAAMNATEVYIGDLSTWNTDSLEVMIDMFNDMGTHAKNLSIGDIGTWDVSQVDMMWCVFMNMGEYSETVDIGDLSQWDVSNSEDFSWMFSCLGAHAKDFYVGDLSQWDMTKAESTAYMFWGTGEYSETFYLGDLSKWNVENIDDMSNMFENAGRMADWKLDLTGWNVRQAVRNLGFSIGVEDKIKEPLWKY